MHRKMLGKTLLFLFLAYFFPAFFFLESGARAQQNPCASGDRSCILESLRAEAEKIDNRSWRDQTYRELAKTYAFEGETDKALAMIDKIETPDTKAMTIRGVGMAVADRKLPPAAYQPVFAALHEKAQSISHPASHAIALTYIAMAQAFAGDNDGAWATAAAMDNPALQHKAYGETAEIQAERGDFNSAMKSEDFISDEPYRNKSLHTVSKIFADGGHFESALGAAEKIKNPYMKAQALQYILDRQKPREITKELSKDEH